MRRFTRFLWCCVALTCVAFTSRAQLTGTITVPSTIYPTLAAAIDSLNNQGVGTGGVTVNVTANQTAPVGGYRLGSATLNASTSTGNRVTIYGNGNTVTAYTGTSATADGIFYIQGTDWVLIRRLNLAEASGNTTATTRMEWGYSLVKRLSAAPYDGCQNVSIDSCSITLVGTYANTVGIRAAHSVAGATAALAVTGATAASANSFNEFSNNVISGVNRGIDLVGINSPAVYDRDNKIGGAAATAGNRITVGGGSSAAFGIQTQYDSIITFRNNVLSIASGQSAATSLISPNTGRGNLTVTGNTMNVSCSTTTQQIAAYFNDQLHRDAASGAGATSTHTITGNVVTGNNPSATSGQLYGVYEDYAYCQTLNVSNNTFRDINWGTGTGSVYGIGHNYSYAMNITDHNNLVYNVQRLGTSGYLYLQYYYEISAPAGSLLSVQNNVTRNIRNRQMYLHAIHVYGGTSTSLPQPRLIARNNVVDSIDMTAATGTAYCRAYIGYYGGDGSISENNRVSNVKGGTSGTSYVYAYMGYTSSSRSLYTVKNNIVENISGVDLNSYNYFGYYTTRIDSNIVRNVSSTTDGLCNNYIAYYGDSVIASNNRVRNINMRGAATLYNYMGMYSSNARIFNNVVDSISTQSGTIYGFYSSAYGPNEFYNNRLSRVYSSSTSNTIYGWSMGGNTSGSYTVYNNIISDIFVPSGYSNANSSLMSLSAAIPYRIYNNTLRMSPGVPAAFDGVDYIATAQLDLRNNIIHVDASPGTAGFTAAILRSAGTAGVRPTNFLPTSDGNILYAPAAPNAHLYAEGTAASLVNTYSLSNDPNFNTSCGLWKAFLGHNYSSFTENNLTAGATPGIYRPSGASFAESGSVPTPVAITTDYEYAPRTGIPDIGALEFVGSGADRTPPQISYTPIPTQSYCVTSPRLTVSITDRSGVSTTAPPRLYYKKANDNTTDADAFGVPNNSTGNGWKYVTPVSSSGSQYIFEFDYNLLRSAVAPGDSIKYFIIAQDNAPTPNVSFSLANFTSCPTSVNLGPANGPLIPSPETNGFRVLTHSGFTAVADPGAACGSGSTTVTINPSPAGANIQWQSATLTGAFANIPGATGQTYTSPVISTPTRYRAILTCDTAALATTASDTFNIATPAILSTRGATICGFDSATISAVTSPNSTANWYASATGGTALGSGNTFVTPQIGATTTYYVSAATSNAVQEVLSATKRATAYGGSVTDGYMMFRFNNASTDFYSTTIYPYTATVGSTLVLNLYDSLGYVNSTAPVAAPVTVTLPFAGNGVTPLVVQIPWRNIPRGTYYVTITMGTGARLNYDYPIAPALPITSPSGASQIVGTYLFTSTDYYYPYLFDNVIGADCEVGTRTPVQVRVNAAPAIAVSSPDSAGICLGASANVAVSSPNPDYVYTWMPGGITGASLTTTPTVSTNYRVRAVDPYTGCVAVDSVNINVNAQTVAPVITPNPATICAGNPVQLTANLPGGINNLGTIGTGTSSTTSGMPYYTSSTRYHSQYLVTAAELNTMGATAATAIKSWAVNVNSPGTVTGNFNIKIAHAGATSSITSFGCAYAGPLTQVYNNPNYQPVSGWNTHTFQTPFFWDGVSNIVIDVSFDKSPSCGSATGTSSTVFYHTAGSGYVVYYYSNADCALTGCWTGTTYTTTFRPNMQFTYGPPAVINWLNVTGLYRNSNGTGVLTTRDTVSMPFAAPTTTTVYRAVANVQGCISLPSAPDTVYVVPSPNVTITPAGPQNVCAGQTVNLCVPQASTNTYQWFLNNSAIAGATANCYTASASGTYKVTVTSSVNGCVSTSANTTVTVSPAPAVTVALRGAATICKGVNDTLVASGAGLVSYQWKENGVNIPGATNSRLIVTTSGVYTVEVANANGCIATSAATTITVNVTPTTITPQGPTNFCSGSVVLQAPTAPAGATFTYQWRLNGVNIAGQTTSTLTATASGSYTVLVTNTTTGCADSSVATVVNAGAAPSAAITLTGGSGICQGGTATLNAISQPGLCYQWNLNGAPITGATNASYTTSTPGSYTVTVSICSTPTCTSTTGTPTVINVNPLPVATATAAGAATFCEGGSVIINANAGTGYTYQWNLNAAPVAGETSAAITARTSGSYTVTVTNPATGCSATSNAIAVTVSPAPATTITSATPTTFCEGGNVTLCVPAGATSYAWNLNGAPIPGATANCYTAAATGVYSVRVIGTNGCAATGIPTSVQINQLPDVTTSPAGNATVCQGASLQLSVVSDASYDYQWMRNGIVIGGATNATYQATAAGNYSVQVSNRVTNCSATSADIVVNVDIPPVATATLSGNGRVCQGDVIRVTAASGAGYTYQWRRNGVNIVGAVNSFYDAAQSGAYSVVVSAAGSLCSSTSNAVSVTVDPRPAAFITYNTPLEFCAGSAVVLTANPGANLTYQWIVNGVPNGNTGSFNESTTSGRYTLRVTNNFGCTSFADTLDVLVHPKPTPAVVRTGNSTLGTTIPYVSYQWYLNNAPIGGATGPNYDYSQNGAYKVQVVDMYGCDATSDLFFVANVGVPTTALGKSIRIFPNPTNSVVNVEASVNVKLALRDVAGKLILEASDTKQLNLGDVAAGMYMLYVSDMNGTLLRAEKITRTAN